ncbi:unnamed protein product [Miscanthus lutarioriparius]|uniref:DNA-directed RNA polymerase n=1 Tax=Miscanthus lutarioriparius TaxID=422564 RepID=A0A811MLN3_9POAL|nr:unnamed protein product [Miscanthus lutarioriparius]
MAELLIWAEVRHQCGEGSSPAASGWECLSVLCRCAGALVCGRRHDATNETQNNVGVDKDGVSEVTGLGRIGGLPQIRIADKEAFDVIDMQDCDASVINTISATIKESDELCEGFHKSDKARQYVDELDNFRNKRLDLPGELLGRELRAHLRLAERRMVKTIQRDLNSDRELQDLERYIDASIVTNGLNRAFSPGSWCHPYKRAERCSGIVATLRRTNPLQMMSDLRKTRQRVAYAGKAGDARYP